MLITVGGDIVYKIYENTSGQLKLINTVSTNSAKIDIATGGKHKYVIKTAYQNYEGNMSSGNEVTVELPEDATFTLNGGNSITVEVGSSFTDPGYKVMSGSTDVTSKAKLKSKVITDSIAGKEVSTIDTSSVKTYTINYTIEYDGNVKVLTRSVIVTATKKYNKKSSKCLTLFFYFLFIHISLNGHVSQIGFLALQ